MMSKPGPLIGSRAASSTAERETFNLTVQGSIPWRPTSCVAGVTESAPAFYADDRGSTPPRRATLRWSKTDISPGPQPGGCGFEPRTEHAVHGPIV